MSKFHIILLSDGEAIASGQVSETGGKINLADAKGVTRPSVIVYKEGEKESFCSFPLDQYSRWGLENYSGLSEKGQFSDGQTNIKAQIFGSPMTRHLKYFLDVEITKSEKTLGRNHLPPWAKGA